VAAGLLSHLADRPALREHRRFAGGAGGPGRWSSPVRWWR
jgi:hypothetical protein